MALSTGQIKEVFAGLIQEWSLGRENIALTKDRLLEAATATEAYIEATQGDYNAALPVDVRGALTAKQKTDLFTAIAQKRREAN